MTKRNDFFPTVFLIHWNPPFLLNNKNVASKKIMMQANLQCVTPRLSSSVTCFQERCTLPSQTLSERQKLALLGFRWLRHCLFICSVVSLSLSPCGHRTVLTLYLIIFFPPVLFCSVSVASWDRQVLKPMSAFPKRSVACESSLTPWGLLKPC